MKNLEEIQKMKQTSQQIRKGFSQMSEYKQNSARYDKTGYGFNLDSRFAACDGLNVHVDSWMGVYGDSSCGNIVKFHKEVFNTHLLKVLQLNFPKLMEDVAISIDNECKKYKEQAEKELNERLEFIKSI